MKLIPLLISLILLTPMSANAAPFLQPNDRVLFEGDSLTDGLKNNYGRQMGWDKTWAHRVDEWLFTHRPELNLECKNLAVGGNSTRNLLARVEASAAFKPTVVLFTMGTNDTLTGLSPDEFLKNLTAWCERLQAAGCRTFIHVGGFLPCPNVDNETRGILGRCQSYDAITKEVVEAHGGFQIDVGPYLLVRAEALDLRWKNHTVYSSGVHYNALGNELIAGAVLTRLGFWKVSEQKTTRTP
jgi:lysophospholipase L1-like esterase